MKNFIAWNSFEEIENLVEGNEVKEDKRLMKQDLTGSL